MKDRILAFDIGDKRIGVAVSDPLGITAQGLETYTRCGDDEKDAKYLRDLAAKYIPVTLLFGMPRNMNGTYGPMAEKVRAFAEVIAKEWTGPIEFYDERLTTASAERILIQADMSRQKRRKVIDKVAAVVILQGYLEFISSRSQH